MTDGAAAELDSSPIRTDDPGTLDLRLIIPAAAAWLAAGLALAAPPSLAFGIGAGLGVFALIGALGGCLGGTARSGGGRATWPVFGSAPHRAHPDAPGHGRARASPRKPCRLGAAALSLGAAASTPAQPSRQPRRLGAAALSLGAAGLALASLGTQGSLVRTAPLVDAATAGNAVRVEFSVESAPSSLGPSSFGGGERIAVEGLAREVRIADQVAPSPPGTSLSARAAARSYLRVGGRSARAVAFLTLDAVSGDLRPAADRGGSDVPAGVHLGDVLVLRGRPAIADPAERARIVFPSAVIERASPPTGWRGVVARLRAGLTERAAALPGDAGALVPGMAIGDTSAVPQDLDQAMKASSLTHLTAVSGAHVAIVLGAILAVSAALRIPRGGRALVGAVGLIGFAALVGPAPSVLRSALMGGAIVLGLALGRGRAALGALGGSVLCLIVADPWMSREYGFALSVAATAGLIVVAPRWQRWLARYLPKALAAAIAVPAAAQAACAPIIAAFAGQVSLIGVLANAAAAPAVPLATASGVAGCLLGPLGGWPADAALRLAAVGTGWIARVARWGAALPGAVLPWPTGASGAAGLAVATVIGVALVGVAARTRRRRQALAVATICAVLIAWTPLGANTRRAVSALTQTGWARDWAVAVCDVGQGAAVAIRAGPSSAVLVDAGPARGGADTCLDALGIDNLAAVVLTHLHADHVGGLGAAIQGRAPGTILAPVDCGQGAAQTDLRQAARDARIVQVSSRDRAGLPVEGSAQEIAFEVFPSDLDARCRSDGPARTGEDSVVNDASLTVHATVRGVDVWVLGDLELSGQAALARALPNSRIERGKVSVTVVAHHGSAKQDERLAAALAPDIAAFSAGIDNDYGHPTQTALDLYAEVGAAIVRTDRDGHLAVRADGTVWGSRANGPSG